MQYTRILSLLCMLTSSITVYAQDREVLWNNPVAHGGFGGLTLGTGFAGENINYWYGVRGAWLIDHRFYLGGAGILGLKPVATDQTMNTAGVLLGYRIAPQSLLHWAGEISIGTGNVVQAKSEVIDSFIVFEPALMLEVNLDQNLVANAGVSYRHLVGADPNYSGVNFLVNFIAGYF